jgi:hypothetical protein
VAASGWNTGGATEHPAMHGTRNHLVEDTIGAAALAYDPGMRSGSKDGWEHQEERTKV